jgi:hypothetical protein|tara:strand:- start:248 stop:469 length:222 start_codon:yes stop_codon:yes gene_type:complete
MISKLILFILSVTIVACFYLQTQQTIDLENKVESLESDVANLNETVDEFDRVFILLIEEIRQQKSHRMAQYYK